MSNVESKREQEKRIVELMIRLYWKKKHGTKKELCLECQVLHDYAMLRSDKCPWMIFYHPVMAICHVIESKKEKKRLEKENEY